MSGGRVVPVGSGVFVTSRVAVSVGVPSMVGVDVGGLIGVRVGWAVAVGVAVG